MYKYMIAALQIDPLDKLTFNSDTSILLALELQARGYQIYTYQPNNLSLVNGAAIANGNYIQLYNDEQNFHSIIETKPLALENAALILIRQNPPFNMDYISATYFLDFVKDKTLVLNNPTAVRNNIEKLMVYHLPQYLPPSTVSQDLSALCDFWRQHKEIILKPLYGYGGNSIKYVTERTNFHSLALNQIIKHKQPLVAQKFLPSIKYGDTRVTMLQGEVLGVMRRVPAKEQIESNLAMGGTAIAHNLTKKEQEICNSVGKLLRRAGIFLAGVDLIQEHLIEINITSPTGLKALNKIYNKRFEVDVIDAMLA